MKTRMTSWVMGIVCAAGLSAGVWAADEKAPKSFIMNGSLEEQVDGKAVGWSTSTSPAREDVASYLAPSMDKAKDGDWSLKLNLKTPPKDPQDPKKEWSYFFAPSVSRDVLQEKGKTLLFTAWVYAEPGVEKPSRLILRMRVWRPNEKGDASVAEAPIDVLVTPKIGEWTRVEATGMLNPNTAYTDVDMQCGWAEGGVVGVQYVDDLRLVVKP